MGKKLKKLDPAWRIIVALALVFAFMPALAVSVATPVHAEIVGYTDTTVVPDSFNPDKTSTFIYVYTDTGEQNVQACIMNAGATVMFWGPKTLQWNPGHGHYSVSWDGKTNAGVVLPEGTYYIWSKTSEQTIWTNMTPVTIDTTPPSMVSAKTGIGASTVIDVTFSEDIGTAEIPDFTVTNPDCTINHIEIMPMAKVVRLFVTLTAGGDLKGHETPTVTLASTVTDIAGNEAVPGFVVASDGIDPTITKVVEEECINAENESAYVVTVTTEPFATVTVTITDKDDPPNVATESGKADENGYIELSVDCSGLIQGDTASKVIVAEDAAGNTDEWTPSPPCKDTVAPVVTIEEIDGVTAAPWIVDTATPTISGTATDDNPCCDAAMLKPEYNVDSTGWNDVTSWTYPDWSFQTSTLTTGPHSVDIRSTDCCLNVGTASLDFVVDLVPGPPELLDAVTGWTWDWHNWRPWNTNSRTTIMLVYSEPLDPLTVSTDDFRVDGYPPLAREVHMYDFDGHTFGVMFLTVATMPTYATPLIHQHGPVADYAGYESVVCIELEAQDGIAPLITVTARPEMPGYNDLVTVTATASEQMSEAYIYIWDGTGDQPHLRKPLPIKDGTELQEWLDKGWKVMEPMLDGRDWTYSFLYAYEPDDMVMVEVSGHDSSYYTDGWPVEEPLYPCFWKHEKWYQESLYFMILEKFEIWLCQGWNFISVPRPLINPSLDAVFPSGVTVVYYYTGGPYGSWQYASYDNLSGRWYNPYGMTIEDGKGYFVYCSPPNERVIVWLSWFGLTPPSYSLVKGWNMIGYTQMAQDAAQTEGLPLYIKHYLRSLYGNATVMYTLDPRGDYYGYNPGWLRFSAGITSWNWYQECMYLRLGYWLFLVEPGILGP